MDADFSIELGRDDPVLDFPWRDPSGRLVYLDLKRHPESIAKLEEAHAFPEIADVLRALNSSHCVFESAKCDAWVTTDLVPEEDIFGTSHKAAGYVDLVCSDVEGRHSYEFHKEFASKLTELLRRVPEIEASVETCVRRCFFGEQDEALEGFYFTIYISGFGNDEERARKNWSIASNLVANAILQLSTHG
jgi:hypothetical protein